MFDYIRGMKTTRKSQWFEFELTSGKKIEAEIRQDGDYLFETGDDYFSAEDLVEIKEALGFIVNLIEEEECKPNEALIKAHKRYKEKTEGLNDIVEKFSPEKDEEQPEFNLISTNRLESVSFMDWLINNSNEYYKPNGDTYYNLPQIFKKDLNNNFYIIQNADKNTLEYLENIANRF